MFYKAALKCFIKLIFVFCFFYKAVCAEEITVYNTDFHGKDRLKYPVFIDFPSAAYYRGMHPLFTFPQALPEVSLCMCSECIPVEMKQSVD